MKNRRILSAFLAVSLLLLLFTGCAKTPESVKGPGLDDLKETDSLVIYVMKDYEDSVIRQIEQFHLTTGINAEVVTVEEDVFGYTERIMNDLAAGYGPDVLVLNDVFMMDITKLALNDSLLDLTDVLAEDPDFSEEDYLDGAFEACQVNGRQYTIPTSYDFMLAFSFTEMLADIGFSWDGIDTMADFLEEIARLTPEARKLPEFQQMLSSKNFYWKLYRYSGIRLLDYENGVVLPDEEELREFLEAYKLYFPYDYDASGISETWTRVDSFLQGPAVFWVPFNLTGIVESINILRLKSREYAYHAIPSQTGEIVARIGSQLAIPANAKNTANAYRFIKFLLSEEVQMDQNLLQGIKPIRKSAIHKVIYESTALYENHGYYIEDPENFALTEDEAKALEEVMLNIDRFMQDERLIVPEMMFESMMPFFRDEKSYEECFDDLKNRLTLYLSE